MTLAEYESEIEKLELLNPDARMMFSEPVDEDGTEWSEPLPEFETIELECCHRLRQISVEIRRICWSAPYRAWARDLHTRADQSANEIGERCGHIPCGRYDRFPEFFSGGKLVPAIP